MLKSEQNGRMLVYTSKEMLNEWKLRTQMVNYHRDCIVEREDGIDLDAVLLKKLNDIYERLLVEAPVEFLPVYDVAEDCVLSVNADSSAKVVLSEACVRVLELKLTSWERSVTEFAKADSRLAKLQESEWTRAGALHPVCVEGHRCLHVYSVKEGVTTKVERLLAVCRRDMDTFEFAPVLWDYFMKFAD